MDYLKIICDNPNNRDSFCHNNRHVLNYTSLVGNILNPRLSNWLSIKNFLFETIWLLIFFLNKYKVEIKNYDFFEIYIRTLWIK